MLTTGSRWEPLEQMLGQHSDTSFLADISFCQYASWCPMGPAPGEEQPHAPVQAWGGPAGEQLCGEGPGCPGERQVNHEPAVCPGCQESQWDPGVHQEECGQQDKGCSPSPLHCPGEASSRVLCHKLRHRKFHLNMRRNFFPLRVTEHWNRLPREVVESPSLEIFKTRLDKILCSLL